MRIEMAEDKNEARDVNLLGATIEDLVWFFAKVLVALLILAIAVGIVGFIVVAVIGGLGLHN
jgi:hypothetical protein